MATANKSIYYTRTGNTAIAITPSGTPFTPGTVIEAQNVEQAIQSCYDAWYNACFNNNVLTYTLYTCHLNCHGNCYTVRSRR